MKHYMDFASSIKSTLVWIINISIVIKSSGIYEWVQSITPVKEFFLIKLSQHTFLLPFIRVLFVLWVDGCNIRSSNVWDKEIKNFTGPIISTVCYKRSLTIITEPFLICIRIDRESVVEWLLFVVDVSTNVFIKQFLGSL